MGENKETKQFFFESYELACPMAITGYIFYIFISGLPPTTLGETRQVLCRDLASNQDDYLWRLVGQQKKRAESDTCESSLYALWRFLSIGDPKL